VPALLLAALAVGRGLDTPLSRGLFFATALYAVASHALLTATFAHLSRASDWPVATTSAWFLARGWTAHTLASAAGVGGVASLLPPTLLSLLAVLLVARAAHPMRPAAPVAALLGLAPLVLLLARPPALGFHGRLWRASVFGRFSGLDPERRELREAALTARTEAERRHAMETWRDYGPRPAPSPPP